MIFKVIGIEKADADRKPVAKVTLLGKHADTFYGSQIYVRVPWACVQTWPIDAEFELVPYLPSDGVIADCLRMVENAEAKAEPGLLPADPNVGIV